LQAKQITITHKKVIEENFMIGLIEMNNNNKANKIVAQNN
jgi:hypothetical protein